MFVVKKNHVFLNKIMNGITKDRNQFQYIRDGSFSTKMFISPHDFFVCRSVIMQGLSADELHPTIHRFNTVEDLTQTGDTT